MGVMARINQLRMWQVQAQASGTTHDGWSSSRQVRSMIVGAPSPGQAAAEVSHLVWDMTGDKIFNRATFATVIEVINGDNGDVIPLGKVTWVRVAYRAGSVQTDYADTYAELTAIPIADF